MSDHRCLDAAGSCGAADDAITIMMRQRLLRAAQDFWNVQDHLDCAELADAAGLAEHAEQLRTLARLRLGFAPEHGDAVDVREDGQWSPPISLAATELKPMLVVTRALEPLPQEGSDLVTPAMLATAPPGKADNVSGSWRNAARSLYDALRASHEAGAIAALADLLHRLDAELVCEPSPDLASYTSGTLSQLIDAFAFASLQQFLQWRHHLAHAPFGSAELLHLAAHLSPARLGAYLTKISYIVRDSTDLFALLEAATAETPLDHGEQDRWLVLFATGMQRHQLHELVEELADIGRMRPLWGIFAVALRRADGDIHALDGDLLLRLRDAGLDNDDLRLAAETQRIVARRLDDSRLEWRILGDILATAGDIEAAGVAYHEGLSLAPGDSEINLRLAAMRSGKIARFAVLGGYGWRSRRRGSHQQSEGMLVSEDDEANEAADPSRQDVATYENRAL